MIRLGIEHLTKDDKDENTFLQIESINLASFKGVELPPTGVFKNAFETEEVFVVRYGTRILGFAFVTERNDEPFIRCIAVEPGVRGQGVGRSLLTIIERWAKSRNKNLIELTCKIDNSVAIRLYLKCGYRIQTIAKKFYGSEDGLIMRREL